MCETCGVTDEQYDDARLVAHWSVIRTWYANFGASSADEGYPQPTADEIAVANDHIRRYHAAHPGQGLTEAELLAEFAARGL